MMFVKNSIYQQVVLITSFMVKKVFLGLGIVF